MRVLVTGSEGSLMQWTIKHLVDEHEVIGVDNYARYDDYGHVNRVPNEQYEFYKADLSNYGEVMKVVDGNVDLIINAAGLIYGVKGFHEYPADILSNDITIDRNIMKAAVEYGVPRVSYISSSMVYERTEPPHHEDEVWDGPIPSTDYGLSKVAGERYAMAFQRQYDVDYTIWRPFNVLTPFEIAEDEEGQSHVFADFIKKLIVEDQNPMDILGSGEQTRCFTWIDDIASAIANWSAAPETRNEAYNVGSTRVTSITELAQLIHEEGVERGIRDDEPLEFNHKEIYDDDVKERRPSVEKAKEDFGFETTVELEEMITRCIDNLDESWYK